MKTAGGAELSSEELVVALDRWNEKVAQEEKKRTPGFIAEEPMAAQIEVNNITAGTLVTLDNGKVRPAKEADKIYGVVRNTVGPNGEVEVQISGIVELNTRTEEIEVQTSYGKQFLPGPIRTFATVDDGEEVEVTSELQYPQRNVAREDTADQVRRAWFLSESGGTDDGVR